MTVQPANPKVFHITHANNLPAIIADGGLFSDAVMIRRGGPAATIGMSNIKRRRLALPVRCHPGDHVGEYVPFYFCPRSIMLYLIHCANHPELAYRGGQSPIVHLEADLASVVAWANAQGQRWAFSLSNAGAAYAEFRTNWADLPSLDWSAIASTDFRSPSVKEGKQAEFLVHGFFPWTLITQVGTLTHAIAAQVTALLAGCAHRPPVTVHQDWYY